MKLKHVFAASLWVALLAVASCKKDNTNDNQPKPKTTAEKLQTKWALHDYTLHVHTIAQDTVPAQDTSATYPASTTDYFDFRSDSSLRLLIYPDSATLGYSIKDDSTVVINNLGIGGGAGTYRLRNFTDKTLTLYTITTDPTNAASYAELSWNLTK